ncbi:MAG: hypothetical protein A2287_02445 [Candidatus Melainabacteria bacterium RIFOXYA12_FULL_32_12]|nr:MAG: hypothetical protein A2255_05870 [Candidatus Melainabacteria bacterium RIFOXYA2_FULL_32_9]OGI30333.1 MAG: hypothetical protein A2287_02445 [Candidatus Melainabacteria bacterium RIFOXYA12_FULL_32_12]
MKRKILLVDDSVTQLTSLKVSLLKSGFEVVTAKDGIEGIFAAYQMIPDLIIADIVMPEINGYQFCRLLKNDDITRDIPIVLLTHLNEKLDRFWGLRAGADAFLTKDRDITQLLEIIEKFLSNTKNITEEERKKIIEERQLLTSSCIQAKIKHILDQSLIESTIINEFRNLSEYVLNTVVLNKELLLLLTSILDYNVAGIFFNDRDDKKEKTLVLSLYNINLEENMINEIKKDFFNTIFSEDFSLNRDSYTYEIFEKVNNESTSVTQLSSFQSRTIIPIVYADKVLGGLCLYHAEPEKFQSSRIVNIVLEELKILMRIRWLYSETKFLTITDGLTGLYNRRYFQQALDREFARAKRYGTDLSLAMFDIDHFKKLNDTYGHQFGDKILAEVAKIIKSSLRRTDYVTRYGGEEFVVILPETSLERTAIPIERLRKRIEQEDFRYGDTPVRVTVSIGIANLTPSVVTEKDLLKRADMALYTAKDNGRNRIEFYFEN